VRLSPTSFCICIVDERSKEKDSLAQNRSDSSRASASPPASARQLAPAPPPMLPPSCPPPRLPASRRATPRRPPQGNAPGWYRQARKPRRRRPSEPLLLHLRAAPCTDQARKSRSTSSLCCRRNRSWEGRRRRQGRRGRRRRARRGKKAVESLRTGKLLRAVEPLRGGDLLCACSPSRPPHHPEHRQEPLPHRASPDPGLRRGKVGRRWPDLRQPCSVAARRPRRRCWCAVRGPALAAFVFVCATRPDSTWAPNRGRSPLLRIKAGWWRRPAGEGGGGGWWRRVGKEEGGNGVAGWGRRLPRAVVMQRGDEIPEDAR
jgi:hypothetical protein